MRGIANVTTHSLAPDLDHLRHNGRVLLKYQLRLKLGKGTHRRTGVVDDVHYAHLGWTASKRAGIASLSIHDYLALTAYVTLRG